MVDFTKDTRTSTNAGQFIAAISVAAFGDVEAFKHMVDTVFTEMGQSTPLPGHDPIRIPGAGRGAIFAERSEKGIPLHPNIVKALAEIAGELHIPKLG